MKPIQIEEQVEVAYNEYGYRFCVGRVGSRWMGYALGGGGMFFMPGVSEGCVMGLTDRDEAIRRVGAIAQDPEESFGGVQAWSVPPALRGKPEDYRCKECGRVCCEGDHGEDYDPEDYC